MEISPQEKNELKLLYNTVKEQLSQDHTNKKWERDADSDILLIDGTNTFIRSFEAISATNDNGDHNGGIVGFLRSIGYAIKLLHPTRCVIIFDGIGGSFRRRKIFPEYKSGRKNKTRLNRVFEDGKSIESEEQNYINQFTRLYKYLKYLPVNVINLDHVEADDVISYCALDTFKNSNISIMSTDKDFLQLCSDRIKVWSPTKKLLFGVSEVIRDYGIHPNNFILFRAMDGDKSDNIDGIQGAGSKTIIKCFPFLSEEKIYTVDDVINHAGKNENKYKINEKISSGKAILDRNVSLMQLKDTLLTTTAQLAINDKLHKSNIPKMDRNIFVRLLTEDCMMSSFSNYYTWMTEVFSPLDTVLRT